MLTISTREFQLHQADYLEKVSTGETIILTNHGRKVAMVSGLVGSSTVERDPVKVKVTGPSPVLPAEVEPEHIPMTTTGWCQLHFEKGKNYPLTMMSWEDENGVLIIDKKWACPTCLKRHQRIGRGKLTI